MQGEYTGEMLAQAECERRGQVYDHVDCSYLFQVNEDWALDGRKVGSKLRCGPGPRRRRVGYTFSRTHLAPCTFLERASEPLQACGCCYRPSMVQLRSTQTRSMRNPT